MRLPSKNIFGTLPIEPVALAQKLSGHRWSNEEKRHYPPTEELFAFLDLLGKKARKPLKSKVVTEQGVVSFYKKGYGFLLDFLWWTSTGTALAVESEFQDGIKGMQHDFEKLLCWKSPLKLMIVREHPNVHAKLIAAKLSEDARSMSQFVKNECFVLFVFGMTKNTAYLYRALKDQANKFEFEEISLSKRK